MGKSSRYRPLLGRQSTLRKVCESVCVGNCNSAYCGDASSKIAGYFTNPKIVRRVKFIPALGV